MFFKCFSKYNKDSEDIVLYIIKNYDIDDIKNFINLLNEKYKINLDDLLNNRVDTNFIFEIKKRWDKILGFLAREGAFSPYLSRFLTDFNLFLQICEESKKFKKEITPELLNEFKKYNSIKNNIIGDMEIRDDRFPYFIKMKKEYVKGQLRPIYLSYITTDPNYQQKQKYIKEIIALENPHVIYSCPNGHYLRVGACGIPQEFEKCPMCTDNNKTSSNKPILAGGRHHFLAPGNYIVYHSGNRVSALNCGQLSVANYSYYESMFDQYNKDVDENFKNSRVVKKIPENEKIKRNEDELLPKILLEENDEFIHENDRDPNNKSDCFACGDKLDPTDFSGATWILPCGHLLHRECVLGARGLPTLLVW